MDIPTNSDNFSMVELYSLVSGINLIRNNNNDNVNNTLNYEHSEPFLINLGHFLLVKR